MRPLGIQPGLRVLARLTDAPIVPVALQYGFREEARPAAVVCFGEPLPRLPAAPAPRLAPLALLPAHPEPPLALLPPLALEAALEAAWIAGLRRGEALLDDDDAGFHPLVAPPTRRPDRGLGARLLAALTPALPERR